MFTKPKRILTLFVVSMTLLTCAGLTLAGKGGTKGGGGGGKGGGGDPPLTGTVYFTLGGQMHSMNPDGSAKTPLPIFGDVNHVAEPSVALHGGHRWFLQLREIAGDFYPDGDPRVELFAIRDDADEDFTVQLTNQPSLEIFPRTKPAIPARWTIDGEVVDGQVSWAAMRWDLATGDPIEGGIYATQIYFDAGNVVGPGAQPVSPIVEVPLDEEMVDRDGDGVRNEINSLPDISDFDISPDATAIVWSQRSAGGLLIADLLDDPVISVPITLGDWDLRSAWSPDGASIAFESTDGIETIKPDGTARTLILADSSKRGIQHFTPAWSPTSSDLVYWRSQYKSSAGTFSNDVYRAAADGSGNTNLTKDTDATAKPVAWR